MKKEFLVGQSNELIKAHKIYDLHNLYDFVGLVLKGNKRQIQVLFGPNLDSGNMGVPIALVFDEIDYLELSLRFESGIIRGLDEMGYKNPDDRDDKWLLGEQQSTSDDHLFFRLDNADYIRVHSQRADIVETAKPTSMREIGEIGDRRNRGREK